MNGMSKLVVVLSISGGAGLLIGCTHVDQSPAITQDSVYA